MTLWMEVDLKNKELPLRISESAAELSRMCGLNPRAVSSAVRQSKLHGSKRCKYVRVEIDDEEE